jgi:atypical dual specificity phosphatase
MNKLNFSWFIENKIAGHQAPGSEQDLIWLKEQGILALVRLIEKNKARVNSSRIEELGMIDYHEPVTDFEPPNLDQISKIINFINKSLLKSKPVGISCFSGKGRTGTVLACYLVSQGYDKDKAINEVREKRPGSIETEKQELAIKAYEASIRGR